MQYLAQFWTTSDFDNIPGTEGDIQNRSTLRSTAISPLTKKVL